MAKRLEQILLKDIQIASKYMKTYSITHEENESENNNEDSKRMAKIEENNNIKS